MNKRKIGFIDLFIDEWHANHFPEWMKHARRGGEFEIHAAFETKNRGGKSLADWCAEHNTRAAESIAEVVESCDVLFVLAPSNPEVHMELADLALRSGKPTYIDKPFAPDPMTARKIFALAAEHHTPLLSSSALRFSDELQGALRERFRDGRPNLVLTGGGGRSLAEYVIHQLEMIVAALGVGARRVMATPGQADLVQLTVDYSGGRVAAATYGAKIPFSVALGDGVTLFRADTVNNYFENFTDAVLDFFADGVSPVAEAETIEVARLLDAAIRAADRPGEWMELR